MIFDDLEEKVVEIFHSPERLERNQKANRLRIEREGDGEGWRYGQLKGLVKPTAPPHQFYRIDLKPSCYQIFDRDHVWPASLIASAAEWRAAIHKPSFWRMWKRRAIWVMGSMPSG